MISLPPRSLAAILRSLARTAVVLGLSAMATGCGGKADDDGAEPAPAPSYDDPNAGFDAAALKELRDKGWDKYLGKFQPSKVEAADIATFYTFAPDEQGPICMQGAAFRMSLREGASDDLLIYLQGGGACWSSKCSASTTTNGAPLPVGWTDGDATHNPLGDFDLAFVGYCDGSVFSGDSEVPDARSGAPDGVRYHHGLQNLSAALDVTHARYPHPRRIALVGSSAGGYGTIVGTALVRMVWPKTELYVINDAGVGLSNPKQPEMFHEIMTEWNLEARIPDSCPECKQGQFTPLIAWALQHDPTIRTGAFSTYEDYVIGGVFLEMAGPDFKALLLQETEKVHAKFPDRFERYFATGDAHTAILAGFYDLDVGGVTIPEWTRRMLAHDASWSDEIASDEP